MSNFIDFEIGEKPNSDWTVAKLKKFVRWKSTEINKRLAEYKADIDIGVIEDSPLLDKEITRLQSLLSKGIKKSQFIGVGSGKRTKKELLYTARILSQFEEWDMYTPESMREFDKKTEKAYKTFLENYADYSKGLSREEYEELVTTFGTISDTVLTQFGSDAVANIYSRAADSEKHNLISYMLEISKKAHGKGLTSEDLADMLAEKMKVD